MSIKLNSINVKFIYIVKNGEIVLTTDYNSQREIGCWFSDGIFKDLKAINCIFKKATASNKENLLKNGVSFYVSTGLRDCNNSIMYNLYINEDVATLEQLEDTTEKSLYYEGVTEYHHNFKLSFKCDLVFNPCEWVEITKERYEELMKNYNDMGYWQARSHLFEHQFNEIIKEAEEELKKNPISKYAKCRKEHAEKMIKKGFYAWNYERVEKIINDLSIKTDEFKVEKNNHAKQVEKITELMQTIEKNISHYQVEKMLKIFNISIKRGNDGKVNKAD